MTAREITEELRNMMDEEYSTWFAIHQTAEDTDDGTGSNDPKEAAEMAVKSDAYSIVLIYDNGSDETYDELVIKDTTRHRSTGTEPGIMWENGNLIAQKTLWTNGWTSRDTRPKVSSGPEKHLSGSMMQSTMSE